MKKTCNTHTGILNKILDRHAHAENTYNYIWSCCKQNEYNSWGHSKPVKGCSISFHDFEGDPSVITDSKTALSYVLAKPEDHDRIKTIIEKAMPSHEVLFVKESRHADAVSRHEKNWPIKQVFNCTFNRRGVPEFYFEDCSTMVKFFQYEIKNIYIGIIRLEPYQKYFNTKRAYKLSDAQKKVVGEIVHEEIYKDYGVSADHKVYATGESWKPFHIQYFVGVLKKIKLPIKTEPNQNL